MLHLAHAVHFQEGEHIRQLIVLTAAVQHQIGKALCRGGFVDALRRFGAEGQPLAGGFPFGVYAGGFPLHFHDPGALSGQILQILRHADAIYCEEIEKAGYNRKIAQYFAVLTDITTPGCHGTGYVCALRALGASNAGKAPAYKLPYDLMEAIVTRITSEVPQINHVVYDITGRPTAAVEWE